MFQAHSTPTAASGKPAKPTLVDSGELSPRMWGYIQLHWRFYGTGIRTR